MRRVARRVALRLFALLALVGVSGGVGAYGAALLGGCGGRPTQSPYDVLKPPDERTATTWIARAFRKNGFEPEGDRKVKIAEGATLNCDIAARGEVWGVMWLRADEQLELKGLLPSPPPAVADGALWVHRGVDEDANQRILILLEKNYEYDPDPRGKGVVRSIQEVEARCVRDVSDFLVRAKAGQIG